ncbi:MAG: hypothetical protein HY286_09230 [Planctomycetes bacterium]|nr:hypothetical protein [Planctomycetota bacterium]
MADEPEIIGHWYQLLDGLQHSSQDFYDSLEAAIERREIPKSIRSRIEFPEGGPFSTKRLYLRVVRDEYTFDLCAAPFGTGFFVSWWLFTAPGCLASLPIIGPVIRFFVKPLTYYRVDTALMFQSAVHTCVQEVLDQLTTAKGIRALTELERKPIMREFFNH